ncbi:PIG-L deacetylase family protein [uncultured Desulfobacter sp.]|uniref:PIG-L deacetylase family protein n=1 Tax=uncultured Desulfobacter sp. TaxID=240139 RepID=UPI002AA8A70A|nr:PIG-L deacetylase family protein [uncultured Desulfobacter sp.]
MNILVVAPHMDDEVLGPGGTIRHHALQGDSVHVCYIADRVYNHKTNSLQINQDRANASKATELLGVSDLTFLGLPDERLDGFVQDILIPLEDCFNRVDPDWLYVCHGGDLNQDHRATFHATMIAARPAAQKKLSKILCYEVPSSTDQAPPGGAMPFTPNVFIDITMHIDTKVDALRHYSDEMRPFPHPRSEKGLRALAATRGMQANIPAAEAFILLREIVR